MGRERCDGGGGGGMEGKRGGGGRDGALGGGCGCCGVKE